MNLETERLILRKWEESDATSLYLYAKDEEVGPIAGWPPHKNVEESLEIIKTVLNGPQCYAICQKETNEAIGTIELRLNGHTDMTDKDNECEMGFWLGKPFWGQGIIPEAAEVLNKYAFTELGMKTIWCGYYDGNAKSKRVQEKIGFIYHHTCKDVEVPLLNEVRIGHTNYMTKKQWKKHLVDKFYKMMRDNETEMRALIASYRCAIMEVETKFKVLNEQFSLEYDRNPIEGIKSRIKSMDSLADKLIKRDVPMTIESIEKNISDIAGLRIICSFPEDIYMLADCLLQQDDITLIERKDYIKNPKPSGYRSLHLIVSVPIFLQDEKRNMMVEVQFRTIAMDFWASLEHKVKYKKNIPEDAVDTLTHELRECADQIDALDQRMQNIKNTMGEYE